MVPPKDEISLISRIEAGFNQRRIAFKLLGKRGPANSRTRTATSPERRPSDAPEVIDLRAFSQRFLPKNISITHYIKYMRTLLPEAYHDLLLGYFFGSEYVHDPKTLLKYPSFNDEQFSIICQTLALTKTQLSKGAALKVHSELTKLVEETSSKANRKQHTSGTTGFVEFANVATSPRHRTSSAIRTLREFEYFVGAAKTDLIHVLGPDLFTIFQQLCDPDHILSDQAAIRYFAICQTWRTADLYLQLLMVRATRNVDLDESPLKAVAAHLMTRDEWGSVSAATRALYACWSKPENDLPSNISGSPATALRLICLIRRELASENAEGLVDSILALYDIDPTMMEWLDWRSVYRILRFSLRLEGLKIAAIHYLMGQPFVGRKFRVVAVAEGDGAFESSLRTSISRLRTLDALSAELLKVSYRCREMLINAVLSPDTAAMLAIILQHDPRWAKQLTKARSLAYDTRVSALRLDLANSFAKAGILERRHAHKIIEEEQSRLRVAYLQAGRLNGLVHVDWSRILVQLNNEFSAQIAFVRRLLNEQKLEHATKYRGAVITALAGKVTEFILVDGPDNFKTTISDSLRHGQLPNLFLMAFDRAISQSTASAIDASSLMAELAIHENYRDTWLLRLRSAQIAVIKQFNNECLSVTAPSFRIQAEAEIAKCIEASLSSPTDTIDLGQCLKCMKILLGNFLNAAGRELANRLEEHKEFAGEITASAEELVLPTNPPRVIDGFRFLHALKDCLNDAEQECLPWMALAEAQATPDAFHLRDLVQLCLLNHRSDAARQPLVEVTISERRPDQGIVILPDPPPITGKYFPLFESLIKNILQNAFSHSGLGLKTRPSIELVLGDARLSIRARNHISPARYRILKDRLGSLQSEANRGNLSAAGEDTGSGLQKMRSAIIRHLGVTPALRLSLSSDPHSFELTIEMKHRHGDIVSKENPDS